MRVSKRVKWIAGVAVVVVVAAVALSRPDVIAVDLVRVEPGPLSVTIDEDGVTRIRTHEEIAAPVTGRLLATPLRAGDAVTRGQVVARLAPTPLDERTRRQAEAALAAAGSLRAEAEARVKQAEALLDDARRERMRSERLGAAGAVADRTVEAARTAEGLRERDLDAARSAANAAVQGETQARMALLGAGASGGGVVEVRSSMAGRVLRVAIEHERVVAAGTPLLEVGVEGSLEVVVDVLSSDAARIRPGTRMVVRTPQAADLEASVSRIEPAAFTKVSPLGVEEQRVNVIAALARPPQGLGDGFRVSTSIVLWSAESVLTVPSTCLVPMAEGWGVFVTEGGRARLRPVTLGQHGARDVEVSGGLRAGDLVIRHPDERITDGVRVESARAGSEGGQG